MERIHQDLEHIVYRASPINIHVTIHIYQTTDGLAVVHHIVSVFAARIFLTVHVQPFFLQHT